MSCPRVCASVSSVMGHRPCWRMSSSESVINVMRGVGRRGDRSGLEEPVVQVEFNLLKLSGTPQAQNEEGAQKTGYDARNQRRLKDVTCASHRRKHTSLSQS